MPLPAVVLLLKVRWLLPAEHPCKGDSLYAKESCVTRGLCVFLGDKYFSIARWPPAAIALVLAGADLLLSHDKRNPWPHNLAACRLLAYGEDTVGNEMYTLHVKDLETG